MKQSILFLTPLFTLVFGFCQALSPDEENFLREQYAIKGPNDCRIAKSKEVPTTVGNGLQFAVNHQLACVLLGYKDLYWTPDDLATEEQMMYDPEILRMIKNEKDISVLRIFYKEEGETKAAGFIYRNNAELNAFRFALVTLWESEGYLLQNWYLYGALLNYPEADRDFFYVRSAFFHTLTDEEKEQWALDFIFWPTALQERFNAYERDIWPQTPAYEKYQIDKEVTENFLRDWADIEKIKNEITSRKIFRCWGFNK